MGIDSNFNWPAVTEKTLAIIMGGGAGTRLFPLTKERSKPAVPLAGKYRLVDIPISNCLNSGLRRIYVLTQFNSVSLHRHIHATFGWHPCHPPTMNTLTFRRAAKIANLKMCSKGWVLTNTASNACQSAGLQK